MDTSVFNEITALALCRNISEAARALNISPSILSRHISQIERQLGQTLFERRRGSPVVTPTAHGEVFISAAQDIQLRLIQLSYDLSRVGSDSLAVRIGSTVDKSLLQRAAFAATREELPEYRVTLTNNGDEASLSLLEQGKVDLACEPASDYLMRAFDVRKTAVHHLYYEPLFIMVHPSDGLASLDAVPVARLQGFFFLHTYAKSESFLEAHLHEICNRLGFEALIEILPFENTFALLHERLAPGHGAAVPRSQVAALQADFPEACFLPLEEKWAELNISVFVPDDAKRIVHVFADELIRQFEAVARVRG